MKRLLCLVSSMNTGGAETFLMKIYRKLDKSKYQMDFCVNLTDKGFYDDEIKKNGGQIYVIPSKSSNINGFKKGLSKIVKDNHYDYVMRVTSNAMGFWDLKIAKKSGAKRCIARSSNSSDGKSIKAILAHKIGQLLYLNSVDVKIAPSDLAAMYTFGKKNLEDGKVFFLHNAVDLDVYRYEVELRTQIRKEFGICEDITVVGHVGRFSNQKNHTFLLEIFKAYNEKNPQSILMLVGKGELEDAIREKAEMLGILNKVIFAGIRSDVPALLSAMDVFAFPSFYEGMPNTVIEAQATSLPCVIADTITKEVDITGLVNFLPLSDVHTWAETLDNCVKKDINRADTARIREIFIDQGYDIESVTKQFEKLVFE